MPPYMAYFNHIYHLINGYRLSYLEVLIKIHFFYTFNVEKYNYWA
jgi:hypothetical protein